MPRFVIFDVDGVLLRLTPPEEEGFFLALKELHGLTGLSRDWNAYRVRNDVDIVGEILEDHFGRPPTAAEFEAWRTRYLEILNDWLTRGVFEVEAIPGAAGLLAGLASRGIATGIATANVIDCARIRLERAGMWRHVGSSAGAEGGGAKRVILERLMTRIGAARDEVIYVGDNLNDLEAGLALARHFIGFSTDAGQRARLRDGGARYLAGTHAETGAMLDEFLKQR
jgi:phosphoglycolate phosphatase-like HAD superfamily hydrolase